MFSAAVDNTKYFAVHTAIGHGSPLVPGRYVAVRNVSRRAPIPAWITDVASPCDGLPSGTVPFDVDAAQAIADAETIAAAEAAAKSRPVFLKREDLKQLLSTDDAGLELATGHLGCPQGSLVLQTQGNDLFAAPSGSYQRWDRGAVEKWLSALDQVFPRARRGK